MCLDVGIEVLKSHSFPRNMHCVAVRMNQLSQSDSEGCRVPQ